MIAIGTKKRSRRATLEEGVDVPGQHAEARRQRLARARAPALDEELLGEPLSHEIGHVGAEDLLVERIVEGSPQEEGARHAEDRNRRDRRPCSRAPRCGAARDSSGRRGTRGSGSRSTSDGSAPARSDGASRPRRSSRDRRSRSTENSRFRIPPTIRRQDGQQVEFMCAAISWKNLLDVALGLLRRATRRRSAHLHRLAHARVGQDLAQDLRWRLAGSAPRRPSPRDRGRSGSSVARCG